MKELPSDASVTRNVKRAANSLDKLSVRMGVFLRRYPIARLFVIGYMVRIFQALILCLLSSSDLDSVFSEVGQRTETGQRQREGIGEKDEGGGGI